MPTVPLFPGLSALADRYDGFIVDLWGVLHDGVAAFPAAVDSLRALRARNKRIVILSNAPRRQQEVAARNAQPGIAPELSDAVWSSGEDTWRHLSARRDAWYRALGRRCYHLGPGRDHGMRDGLDYDFVDDLGVADFVLLTGALGTEDRVEDYARPLARARARGLAMICANPDLVVVRGGRREICAGTIALGYEELGGAVRYHGKPHAGIYQTCFDFLQVADRRRIAAIGDSLRTDVAGAAAVGIDSIFVAAGIHGEELGMSGEVDVDPARLIAFFDKSDRHPAAALSFLRW